MVGGLGALVHLAVLSLSLHLLQLPFATAQAASVAVAMTGNFFLNNILTYRDRPLRGAALLTGLFSFCAVCALGAAGSVAIASRLFAEGWDWRLAGLGGAAVGSVWNFAMSSALTWSPARRRRAAIGATPSVLRPPREAAEPLRQPG